MDSGFESRSPAYLGLLKVLTARSIPVKQAKRGRTIDIGGGPSSASWVRPSLSSITRARRQRQLGRRPLDWRGRVVLFTGDAEPETERWLLAQPATATAGAPVLPHQRRGPRVGHHGGKILDGSVSRHHPSRSSR